MYHKIPFSTASAECILRIKFTVTDGNDYSVIQIKFIKKNSMLLNNLPIRYHSPFVIKSDKSPPSSEFSTKSSYFHIFSNLI
jgi:hypothetical protein